MAIRIRFFALAALCVCVAGAIVGADPAATKPTTTPATITWDQAKDHVGQELAVVGPVVGVHDFGGSAVLNVGKDFPEPDRFSVFIAANRRAGAPSDLYKGKTVKVIGKITMYRNVPQIEAGAADLVVEPANAPATSPTTSPAS